ncbi:MAG: hypothetical protein DLM59_20600 [Pseudonocardiales bacterium]|nr:MAG: hypothetical protein DLM59_20600 [Pseudonocardiales bacterium]
MLRKTAALIEGIRPDQIPAATPCPEYDAGALRNHLVGWVQFFEEMPGAVVYGMLFFEYVTYGWDLAIGTERQVPDDDAEAAVGLEVAQRMLSVEYRGAGMPFGDEVPVPEDASMVDRLFRPPAGHSPGDPGVS